MLRHLTIDLSQLTVQPDPKLGTLVRAGPQTRKTSIERAAMKAAFELARPLNHRLDAALEVLELSTHPPTVSMVPSRAVAIAAHALPIVTVAVGLGGSIGYVAELAGEGGVYGSTTLEFGLFSTLGFIMGVAAGVAVGADYTLVFGPPSDFAGIFVAFQASVSVTALGPLSVGGSLLFAVGPPTPTGSAPLTFKGISLTGMAGLSPLPASLSIEWSNTTLKPLVK